MFHTKKQENKENKIEFSVCLFVKLTRTLFLRNWESVWKIDDE